MTVSSFSPLHVAQKSNVCGSVGLILNVYGFFTHPCMATKICVCTFFYCMYVLAHRLCLCVYVHMSVYAGPRVETDLFVLCNRVRGPPQALLFASWIQKGFK